jgi:hypothetical protein
MIHCRPEAVPHFTSVRTDGNLLRTPRGTIVVPGVGYPNTGPGGADGGADDTWLYATGLTEVRVDSNIDFLPVDPRTDPDWLPKAMNRGINQFTLYAMRWGVASWTGQCHLAVHAVLET